MDSTQASESELTLAGAWALAVIELLGWPDMTETDVTSLIAHVGINWSHVKLTPAELLARRTLH